MDSLIGCEVTVKETGFSGWVAEVIDQQLVVQRYAPHAGEQRCDRQQVIVHRRSEPLDGFTAITVEREDGTAFVSIRLEDEVMALLYSDAQQHQQTIEAELLQILQAQIDRTLV